MPFKAVSDLLIGCFVAPIYLTTIHLRYYRYRNFHPAGPSGFENTHDDYTWVNYYLQISSFFNSLSIVSSVYTLMFHSIERFLVIRFPLHYRSLGK